ncbi:pilus assembly protein [Chania multitudinisentens RB-25]|uniref:Pilus assembly protein n=1 Tax=Chania multitudinisentens RB-25 TaxID=1441930 RepID=W0LC01_9GAMM|nr:lytic transglycosylase domain-containing protein [Chania multitudinisentens]AHG19490.2 pilus assembly protein [Chania multitudinisentens RB-25]
MRGLCLLLAMLCSPGVSAFCFEAAGAKYRIDPLLLKAMAQQESGLEASAINLNRDRKSGKVTSTDYGVMQINSRHLPGLKKQGVIRDAQELLKKPCLNVQVGAWILARHLKTCDVSWHCLGSYNAGFAEKNAAIREAYANQVYARYKKLLRAERGIAL